MASYLVAQRPAETNLNYLGSYIQTLRQKIEPDPEQPMLILIELRVGYRLRAREWAKDPGIGARCALQSNLARANAV